MMRRPTTYVPDEIWNDPNVNHYEYGQDTSVAIYRDGRRVEFDSRVTAERIAADRQNRPSGSGIFRLSFKTTQRFDNHTGSIIGVTK